MVGAASFFQGHDDASGTEIRRIDGNENATLKEPKEPGTQIRFRNGNRERKIKKTMMNGNPSWKREPVPINPWK